MELNFSKLASVVRSSAIRSTKPPKHRPFLTDDGRVLHPTKGFLPKSKRAQKKVYTNA